MTRIFFDVNHFESLSWICYNIVSVFLYFEFLVARNVGILATWPVVHPAPPALEGEVLTPGPPGKSHVWLDSPGEAELKLLGHKGDPYAVAPTPQVPLWWVLGGAVSGWGCWGDQPWGRAGLGAWRTAWVSSQKPLHTKGTHRDTQPVRGLLCSKKASCADRCEPSGALSLLSHTQILSAAPWIHLGAKEVPLPPPVSPSHQPHLPPWPAFFLLLESRCSEF